MCMACHFQCCAWDGFEGCGCDHCGNPDCARYCDVCKEPEYDCMCREDEEDLWEEDE